MSRKKPNSLPPRPPRERPDASSVCGSRTGSLRSAVRCQLGQPRAQLLRLHRGRRVEVRTQVAHSPLPVHQRRGARLDEAGQPAAEPPSPVGAPVRVGQEGEGEPEQPAGEASGGGAPRPDRQRSGATLLQLLRHAPQLGGVPQAGHSGEGTEEVEGDVSAAAELRQTHRTAFGGLELEVGGRIADRGPALLLHGPSSCGGPYVNGQRGERRPGAPVGTALSERIIMKTLPLVALLLAAAPRQEAPDPSLLRQLTHAIAQEVRRTVTAAVFPRRIEGPIFLDVGSVAASARRAELEVWGEAAVEEAWGGATGSRMDVFMGDYAALVGGEPRERIQGIWIRDDGIHLALDSLRVLPDGAIEARVSYHFTNPLQPLGRPQLGCGEVLYLLEAEDGAALGVTKEVPLTVC